MTTLCRDCSAIWSELKESVFKYKNKECPNCLSVRVIHHEHLTDLTIAHIDCDAFYASVEKRNSPALQGKPVIVGGRHRGVVAACCYIARIKGVRSAMPMFEAIRLCPEAIVINPNMKKYQAVGLQIRSLMKSVTPIVEPLSIDEAFLDLSGTQQIHNRCPAQTLVWLVKKIEETTGITASVGLSYNKSLAKIASDLNKPRGFSIISPTDVETFFQDKPVSIIWGVGVAVQQRLFKDGIETVGDLKKFSEKELVRRYGKIGYRLFAFSKGIDNRPVSSHNQIKSVSAESTFKTNLHSLAELSKELWLLSEKVSRRLKASDLVGYNVTLKLRRSNFKVVSRSKVLSFPIQMAEEIYKSGLYLLEKETLGQSFRLIGIGVTKLRSSFGQTFVNSFDQENNKKIQVERAMDTVRHRFGERAIIKGRAL